MAVAILRPVADLDAGWNVTGAPTRWEAVDDDVVQPDFIGGDWIAISANGIVQRFEVGSLPIESASRAVLWAWCSTNNDLLNNPRIDGAILDGADNVLATGILRGENASGWGSVAYEAAMGQADVDALRVRVTSAGGGTTSRVVHAVYVELTYTPAVSALTSATETDTARALGATKRAALSVATESDAPQALTAQKITPLTPALETDPAQPLAGRKQTAIGSVTEADVAQGISATKLTALTPATEADIAQPLSEVDAGTTPLTPAVETDQAQALSAQKLTALTPVIEGDGAQGVGSRKLAAILSATEADAAQALVSLTRMALVAALESDTTQPLSIRKLAALVAAAETDAAQPLSVAILNIGVIDGAGGISGADASSGEKALAGATPTETGLIE